MPGYAERDAQLRRFGVFAPNHFFNMVVDQLWQEWDVPGLCPTAAGAREAQKRLITWQAKVGRFAERYSARLAGRVSGAVLAHSAAPPIATAAAG
jgi:hypothetical protein